MKKVLICWVCCLTLAAGALQAQVADSTNRDTTLRDTSVKTTTPAVEIPVKVETPAKEAVKDEPAPAREWDNRWFISPLLKFQIQEFGMLEKNKMGFLSDANELPFMDKINASVGASVYKNIVGRLSFSLDVGMAYGHVTNKEKLISTTEKKTYNLLNAAFYYHLLSHKYRLQPYITVGINNLMNDSMYTSVPAGIGLKFNSKKIMIMGQAAYGYSVSKTIANTLNYSLGVYFPITSKKRKKAEKNKAAAEAAARKEQEEKDKELAKKKDSTANSGVVNNIVINVNVDSIVNARVAAANGGAGANGKNLRNGLPGSGNGLEEWDLEGLNGGGQNGRNGGRQSDYGDSIAGGKTPHAFDLIDYQLDTINGKPVIKFVIYFYYKDHSLTSRAFGTVDKVIAQLKKMPGKVVDIKGYTDNVGSTDYNNYLSMRRSQMTFDYMNSRGIPAERMIVSYYGKEYPVADNTPAHAWLNRRVEIIVHDKD